MKPLSTATPNYTSILITVIICWLTYSLIACILLPDVMAGKAEDEYYFGDAWYYGAAAQNFPKVFSEQSISNYHMNRCFPSFIIWLVFNLLNHSPTSTDVYYAFVYLHIINTLIGIILWIKVAIFYKWSAADTYLSYLALLGSFGVLNFNFHLPIFTDSTAYLLGIILAVGFHTHRYWMMVLSYILAYFTWPTIFLTILLFGQRNNHRPTESNHNSSIQRTLSILFAGLITLGFIFLFIHYIIISNFSDMGVIIIPDWMAVYNAVLISFFIFYTGFKLLNHSSLYSYKTLTNNISLRSVIIIAVLTFLLRLVFSMNYNNQDSHLLFNGITGIKFQIAIFTLYATLHPVAGIICHLWYFGPIFAFILIRFNAIIERIHQRGPYYILFFLVSLFLFLKAEGRHSLIYWPFLIIEIIAVIKTEKWKIYDWILLILFTVITGRIFLPFSYFNTYLGFDFTFMHWLQASYYGFAVSICLLIIYFSYHLLNRKLTLEQQSS